MVVEGYHGTADPPLSERPPRCCRARRGLPRNQGQMRRWAGRRASRPWATPWRPCWTQTMPTPRRSRSRPSAPLGTRPQRREMVSAAGTANQRLIILSTTYRAERASSIWRARSAGSCTAEPRFSPPSSPCLSQSRCPRLRVAALTHPLRRQRTPRTLLREAQTRRARTQATERQRSESMRVATQALDRCSRRTRVRRLRRRSCS